jgi:hypothetical protein
VVIVPEYSDIREAERISQKYRQDRPERGKIGARGHFHVQHHDGDDDGNHAIRECFQPLFAQNIPLSSATIDAL